MQALTNPQVASSLLAIAVAIPTVSYISDRFGGYAGQLPAQDAQKMLEEQNSLLLDIRSVRHRIPCYFHISKYYKSAHRNCSKLFRAYIITNVSRLLFHRDAIKILRPDCNLVGQMIVEKGAARLICVMGLAHEGLLFLLSVWANDQVHRWADSTSWTRKDRISPLQAKINLERRNISGSMEIIFMLAHKKLIWFFTILLV